MITAAVSIPTGPSPAALATQIPTTIPTDSENEALAHREAGLDSRRLDVQTDIQHAHRVGEGPDG